MRRFVKQLWQNNSGQDMIEYALLAALVATGTAVLIPMSVHGSMSHIYSRVTSCLINLGNSGL
jgi:Flp pilus assembly pilin Flp